MSSWSWVKPVVPHQFDKGVLVVVRVVVARREIDDGVEETENEAFGGPVDDDVDGHAVGVDGDFLCIGPGVFYTLEAEQATDSGTATDAHAGERGGFDQHDVV